MRKPLIALTAILSLAAASEASAQAKFNLKMTNTAPEGTLTFKLGPQALADEVKILTDGQVMLKPYGVGVLAGAFESHRAVKDGRADAAYNYPALEVNENPASAFISDIPGGMGPDAKLLWIIAGGGEQLWHEYRHSQGYEGLFCGALGSEVFAHSHKKVETLADFKGLRYRTAGANTWVMRKLGAAPVLVPGPDTFPLLERKGVDAAEYLDPYGNYSLGFHKIAKFVVIPGIHAPGGTYEFLVKKETWDAFPADIRHKIQAACDSVTMRSYATLAASNTKAMADMAASTQNEVVVLKPEVIAAFRKAGREWAEEKIKEENAKGNPWMEKLARSYYAFQDNWAKNSRSQVIDKE